MYLKTCTGPADVATLVARVGADIEFVRCTEMIRVKFLFNGVKFFHEHTLFVVNSLPVAFLCCFGDLFRCFIRKRFYNRWVFLVKSGQFKKNVSCDKTLLFSCPEQL